MPPYRRRQPAPRTICQADRRRYRTTSSVSFICLMYSRVAPIDGAGFRLRAAALLRLPPFARQPLAHRNKVVGREELGRERAPGAALDLDVHDIDEMRRQPQCDDLPDPHHHVPADDLHALGREALPPAGGGEVALDALQVLRLIVLEKDGQQDGLVATHAVASVASDGPIGSRRLTPPMAMLPCSYSNARFKTYVAS